MAALDHLCPPTTAGDIKKNEYVMLNGFPCKIMDKSTSKTGKHGHAKCSITGICVVTGKKVVDVQPAHASMNHAIVTKKEYLCMDIDVDKKEIMLLNDDSKEEYTLSIEGEEAEKLAAEYTADKEKADDYIVTVLTAPMNPSGKEIIVKEVISSYRKQKP